MNGPPPALELHALEVLLCDADGNLFPSEEPAFVASAAVTNRFMEDCGSGRRFQPEELRLATTGMNFRTTAAALAAAEGIAVDPQRLEHWVAEEQRAVTAHLRGTLRPDPGVEQPLRRLGQRFELAAVSSSASARLGACFEATGLGELIPQRLRFSAEDSLPRPTSKPDPAIYLHARDRLGIAPEQGLAIEDSVPGVQSAVAAGFPTVGNVMFVAPGERGERVEALLRAGSAAVVSSWHQLEQMLPARALLPTDGGH